MADLDDFFNISKPLKRSVQPTGQTDGLYTYSDAGAGGFHDNSDNIDPYEQYGDGLAYVEEERQRAYSSGGFSLCNEPRKIDGISLLTSYEPADALDAANAEETASILEKYDLHFMEVNSDLPVFNQRAEILDAILHNKVTVITGSTGCGKTTQIPQYVLDDCYRSNSACNMIVTQPRRIAAATVATRVCNERQWPEGTLCGYQIGLRREVSEDTRLLYCTTGVLLQKLLEDQDISKYTHIFLDEVHERTLDLDFCLLIIKPLLAGCSTKLILMSATIHKKDFVDYFADDIHCPIQCKTLEIEMSMKHRVSIFYLDDFADDDRMVPNLSYHELGSRGPELPIEMADTITRLIVQLDEISDRSRESAVLVFLPGYAEIEMVQKNLAMEEEKKDNWVILPLHSSIPRNGQQMIFKKFPGKRKIILSTNVAESSITLPDVSVIIDSCLTKSLEVDGEDTNLSCLKLRWASKYNCQQRAGRVGRVGPGRVYRLVTRAMFNRLDEQMPPEMLVGPLETTILQSKKLGAPLAVLAQAMNPPDSYKVRRSILNIKQAGGMLLESNGVYNTDDGDLTFLGQVMAALPVDIRVAKLIYLGHIFGVLDDAIVIGACLTVPGLFTNPFNRKYESYKALLAWRGRNRSDLFCALQAYRIWETKKREFGRYEVNDNRSEVSAKGYGMENWAKSCFIELRSLQEIHVLVEDIKTRLQNMAIEVVGFKDPKYQDSTILSIVIGGAFYPSYFVTDMDVDESQELHALKVLEGRDPFHTVYLSNFPSSKHDPQIYFRNIADALQKINKNVRVSGNQFSEKIFIEFSPHEDQNNSVMKNQVNKCVYLALMFGKCLVRDGGLPLRLLRPTQTQQWLQSNVKNVKPQLRRETSNLPSINSTTIAINLTRLCKRVGDVDNLWSWTEDSRHQFDELQAMERELSAVQHRRLPHPADSYIVVGGLYMHAVEGRWRRARVLSIYQDIRQAFILHIDHGEHRNVPIGLLFDVHEELQELFYGTPAFVYEFKLAGLRPINKLSGMGYWSRDAFQFIMSFEQSCRLYGEVFSVVDGVVRVKLFAVDVKTNNRTNVSALLVSHQFAVEVPESYNSEKNHELRQMGQIHSRYEESQRHKFWPPQEMLPKPPDNLLGTGLVKLRGPQSPLVCRIRSLNSRMNLSVNIAESSVNAFVLNERPEEICQGMIVAANVKLSPNDTHVTLQQTTKMPALPGLPALLSVLFAPRVEFRPDPLSIRYASALCGMGVDGRHARHPANDFEVPFDVQFTNEDARIVNDLRLRISKQLTGNPNDKFNPTTRPEHFASFEHTRDLLSRLIRERKSVKLNCPLQGNEWGFTKRNAFLPMQVADTEGHVLPAHQVLPLRNADEILVELRHLIEMNLGQEPFVRRICPLCEEELFNPEQLRMHMHSRKHSDLAALLVNTRSSQLI